MIRVCLAGATGWAGSRRGCPRCAVGATHVLLAGAASNWCIRATAYAALDRGYDLTLIKDAHTTETIEFGNGTAVEAARIVDDLDITMKWLSYPARRNATATAEEIDFGKPRTRS